MLSTPNQTETLFLYILYASDNSNKLWLGSNGHLHALALLAMSKTNKLYAQDNTKHGSNSMGSVKLNQTKQMANGPTFISFEIIAFLFAFFQSSIELE